MKKILSTSIMMAMFVGLVIFVFTARGDEEDGMGIMSEAMDVPEAEVSQASLAALEEEGIPNLPEGITLEDFPLNWSNYLGTIQLYGRFNYNTMCVDFTDPPLQLINPYRFDVCAATLVVLRFFPHHALTRTEARDLVCRTWPYYDTDSMFGVMDPGPLPSDTLTGFGPYYLEGEEGELIIEEPEAFYDLPLVPEFPWFDEEAREMASRTFNCSGDPPVCTAEYSFFGEMEAHELRQDPEFTFCLGDLDNVAAFMEFVAVSFPDPESLLNYLRPFIEEDSEKSLEMPNGIRKSLLGKIDDALDKLDKGNYDAAQGKVTALTNQLLALSGSNNSQIPDEDKAIMAKLAGWASGLDGAIDVCILGVAPGQ